MKKIFTLICSVLLAGSLSAQIPNGSIAPDFTSVDLDGNMHNLYSYLDEGKSVILDLSAAWCAPCWNYHEAGILETIYEEHGPNGDNTMQVLFIESEPTNTLAQITGTTTTQDRAGFTMGDWTAGTTFPIIDDASIAGQFGLQFYPTIMVIRPDRRTYMVYDFITINNLFGGNIPFVPEYMTYIAANDQANDIAILDESAFIFRSGCPETNETIQVTNLGTEELTSLDATITSVDGEVLSSLSWTGNVPPLAAATVNFPTFTLAGDTWANISVSNPNGATDSVAFLNSVDSMFYDVLTAAEMVTFKIRTDFWPEEISWFILDGDGNVLASSLSLGALSCDTEYEQQVTIPSDGCLTLRLQDSFGDGILNGGVQPGSHGCTTPNGIANQAMGSIELASGDGEVLYSNISYGGGRDIQFLGLKTAKVDNVAALSTITVFPNPVSDRLNINFDLSETTELEISVYNNLGQMVHSFPVSSYGSYLHELDLDVTAFAKGMYTITFTDQKGITTKRFTVN